MRKLYATFNDFLRNEYQGPYVATDIIIRYDDGKKKGIVLIERKFQPYGLALPGGIAERMTLHENAIKEAKEETGLEILLDDFLKPFCVFSDIDQDPRAHIASITYTAVGRGILHPHEDEDAKSAAVYELSEVEQLLKKNRWAFPHHKKILTAYLKERREK